MTSVTALVLVGGLGTRLRSVVSEVPKPMAPVAGRPFLDYLLAQLKNSGISDIVLCVGYGADIIEEHYADGTRFELNIRYSRETELLGTGGALKLAEPLINSDLFLLMNGDSYCETDFASLLDFHQAHSAVATLVAPQVEERARYGTIDVKPNGAVSGFIEKGDVSGPGRINGGIYLLNRRVLPMIPENKACSLERDVFPQLCGAGLFAFPLDGLFIDIGIPNDWQRAQEIFRDKIEQR